MKIQLENLSYLSKEAVKIPNILAIVLFGSHARGEEHKKSDIDLLVIVKRKNKKFEENFNSIISSKKIGRRIIAVYSTPEELKDNLYLTFDILKEGIILYKSPDPLHLPTSLLGWNAMTIFSFNLSNLPQKQKLKLNKIFYTATRKKGRKEYRYPGLIEQCRGKILGKGCFMISNKKENEIEEIFKKYKVRRYKKENVISIL